MLCSCLQIECSKTAVPATLQHCQGCSRTAALILPTAAAGVPVNIPSWGLHCRMLQGNCAQPIRAPGTAPRMELKHLCNPTSSMPEFQSRAKFQGSAANRGGNNNGLYKAGTQLSVLYSQVNQVL